VTTLTCCSCGSAFGVPEHWCSERRSDQRNFYCPNGHVQTFVKSSVEVLREQKDAEISALQAKLNEAAHARLVAQRERDKAVREKRKVERRIAHGVCPCCNKTFGDMTQHMITEHPEFRLPGGKAPKQIAGAA